MTLRIGCQGWNYPSWVGPFYPPGTKAKEFLPTYARVFNTVEIDSTWYATPDPRHVERWAEQVPAGFIFCPKLDREITHERMFTDCAEPLARYLESLRCLGPKLGPILIQCEDKLTLEHEPALRSFLKKLPKDLQFAIEFRHAGWFTDETYTLLSDHRVAWALVQARWIPRKWMLQLGEKPPTGGFHYIRWLGPDRKIEVFDREVHDRSEELAMWAEMINSLASSVPVYSLVNNHYEGHSPSTVRKLQRLLGLATTDPAELRPQPELF